MEIWKNTQTLKENAVEIKIPSTGLEWELYTSSMGCAKAATGLTGALKRSFRDFDKNIGTLGTKNAAEKAYKVWYDSAEKYSNYGALDTEPCWRACKMIVKYANTRGFFGVTADDLY